MQSCKECRHVFTDPQVQSINCRRFPPQVVVIAALHPMTRQATQQIAAVFPTVHPDASCAEFEDRSLKLDS